MRIQWLVFPICMASVCCATAIPKAQPNTPAITTAPEILTDTAIAAGPTLVYTGPIGGTVSVDSGLDELQTMTAAADRSRYSSLLAEITKATVLPSSLLSELQAVLVTATAAPTSSSSPDANNNSDNKGAIIGGIVGAIVIVSIICGVAFWCFKRKRTESVAASVHHSKIQSVTTAPSSLSYFEQRYRNTLTPNPSYFDETYSTPMPSPAMGSSHTNLLSTPSPTVGTIRSHELYAPSPSLGTTRSQMLVTPSPTFEPSRSPSPSTTPPPRTYQVGSINNRVTSSVYSESVYSKVGHSYEVENPYLDPEPMPELSEEIPIAFDEGRGGGADTDVQWNAAYLPPRDVAELNGESSWTPPVPPPPPKDSNSTLRKRVSSLYELDGLSMVPA